MDIAKLELEIRERSFPERVDLAFFIFRNYFLSIMYWAVLGYLPVFLAIVLTVWFSSGDFWLYGYWQGSWIFVFQLHLAAVPFAMIPLSIFLSRRIFGQQPTFQEVLKTSFSRKAGMYWVHFFCRIGFLVIPLAFLNYFSESIEGLTLVFLLQLVVYVFSKCYRPFIDLILYLEQLPLRKRGKSGISAGIRSKRISETTNGGTFVTMLGMMIVEFQVAIMVYCIFLYGYFFLTSDTVTQVWFGWVFFPISCWVGNVVTTIYVFVSYLDCRIRNEGWELELRMKIEAEKLFPSHKSLMESTSNHSVVEGSS